MGCSVASQSCIFQPNNQILPRLPPGVTLATLTQEYSQWTLVIDCRLKFGRQLYYVNFVLLVTTKQNEELATIKCLSSSKTKTAPGTAILKYPYEDECLLGVPLGARERKTPSLLPVKFCIRSRI